MFIISKTPVRISLFGGGTDYPDYYQRRKGAVLGTTIDKYIYLSVGKLSAFFDFKFRISYSLLEKVKAIEEIQHPSVRECLKHLNHIEGLDIHVSAELPAKTGMGSSSSFTVGLLNAIYNLQQKTVSKEMLAKEALHIEQSLIGERVGSQDQIHAAYGGLNIIEFSASGYQISPLQLSTLKKSLLEESLLLFYTGISRFANDILEEQIQNTKAGSKDHYLQEMYEMVFQAKEILLHEDSSLLVDKIGHLLDKSWQLKKQLSSKISNLQVDQYYELAKKNGALGGKLCGAGHGGFLLLMVPKDKQAKVREALKDLLEVHFQFEENGSQIIYQH